MKPLLFVFILLGFHSLQGQMIPFESLGFKDTEFENIGTTIVFEDRDGFLWIEEFNRGLIRYDGKNIEKLFETVNLPNEIRDFYQDEYGYLWILGNDKTLSTPCLKVSHRPIGNDLISDTLYFKNIHLNTSLLGIHKISPRSKFSISKDNKILIHTDSLLLQYYYEDEKSLVVDTIHRVEVGDKLGKLSGGTYLQDGSIIFNTIEDKIVLGEFEENKFKQTAIFTIEDSYLLNFHISDNKGGLLADVNDAVVYIPNAKNPIKNDFLKIDIKGPIEDLLSIDERTILVSTKGNGLFEINIEKNEIIKQYTTNHGLEHPGVFRLKMGKEKIWMGTTVGPFSLPKDYRAFNAYTTDYLVDGKPFMPVNAVNATSAQIKIKGDESEYFAACTGNGLVLFNEKGEQEVLDESNALSSSVIVGVKTDRQGRIWVSPVEGGVNCIFPKGEGSTSFENIRDIELFGKSYSTSHKKGYQVFFPDFFTMKTDDPNQPMEEVFYGANSYMIQILVENEPWLFIEKKSGYESTSGVNLTAQDKAGYLYVANSLGLVRTIQPFTRAYYEQIKQSGRVNKKNKAVYTTEEIIEPVPLSWNDSVFQEVGAFLIHEDEIWLGVESGVLILSSENLKSIAFIPHQKNRNSSPLIPQSFFYNKGSIWAGAANGGMLEYDVESHALIKVIKSEDGLLDDAAFGPKDVSVSSKGIVNYGTASGMLQYNPELDKTNTSDISVVIRDYAFVDNSFGKNELSVSYIALTYDDPKSMYYKTRLKGYDDDWSVLSNNTEIRFTNLSAFLFPKTYEFEVMASDYRNEWHQIKTKLPIKVHPPIWSRWWSFLLYGLLIFLAVRKYTRWKLEEQKKKIALEEAKIIKEQKELIEKKNQENEILLKEIHHRVKNNLQVISSLLNFQSRAIQDKAIKTALLDSQSRVRSMSLIHQKLYRGQHLAAVEMKSYLRNLAESLVDAYADEDIINVELDMENIEIDVDFAIPLGLIANELVTNSLKYAFPNERKGVIKIQLEKQNTDLVLRVADNGVGKKTNHIQEEGDGFGSELIEMLSLQLKGELEQSSDIGFQTQFRFPYQQTA